MINEKSTEICHRTHTGYKIEGLLLSFPFNFNLNIQTDFLSFLALISPSLSAQIAKLTPLLLTKIF